PEEEKGLMSRCWCLILERFARKRDTEPHRLRVTKVIISLIYYMVLILYLTYSLCGLIDNPPYEVRYVQSEPYINPPIIYFASAFSFDMTCAFRRNDLPDYNCAEYMDIKPINDYVFSIHFNATEFAAFSLTKIKNNPDETKNISVDMIYEIDFTFEFSDPSQEWDLDYRTLIDVEIYDPDFFIDGEPSGFKCKGNGQHDEMFLRQKQRTRYYLSPNQNNFIGFKRYKSESLVRDIQTTLGLSHMCESHFIETTFQTANIFGNKTLPGNNTFSLLQIKLLTYEVPIIRQHSTKSVLSAISDFGGALNICQAVFCLMFGAALINPWGFCQKNVWYIKTITQQKLAKNFSGYADKNQKDSSPDALNTRLIRLEKLLSEYIIEDDYLKKATSNSR
ncbi:5830_t:CDS:2, partial [Ambispora leptoticha]